jgi:hypothetical protein
MMFSNNAVDLYMGATQLKNQPTGYTEDMVFLS